LEEEEEEEQEVLIIIKTSCSSCSSSSSNYYYYYYYYYYYHYYYLPGVQSISRIILEATNNLYSPILGFLLPLFVAKVSTRRKHVRRRRRLR